MRTKRYSGPQVCLQAVIVKFKLDWREEDRDNLAGWSRWRTCCPSLTHHCLLWSLLERGGLRSCQIVWNLFLGDELPIWLEPGFRLSSFQPEFFLPEDSLIYQFWCMRFPHGLHSCSEEAGGLAHPEQLLFMYVILTASLSVSRGFCRLF